MELIQPSINYKDSFLQALQEFKAEQRDDRKDYYELDLEKLRNDFNSYINELHSQAEGKNLPEGYVPQSTFWLVDSGEFIGRVSVRHSLTEHLLKEGGHIGYDIRPSKRRMGYGKKILQLVLPRTKELGIDKALVTCNETNTGSRKIIEANGGVFENSIIIAKDKPRKLRYWIKL